MEEESGSFVAMGSVNSPESQQVERRGIRPPIAFIVVSYTSLWPTHILYIDVEVVRCLHAQ